MPGTVLKTLDIHLILPTTLRITCTIIIIPILQMRKQTQRSEVTYPKAHSQ